MKKIIQKIKAGMLKEMLIESIWIYQYAKQYRWAIVFYICLGIFSTVMTLGSSLVSKLLIDTVTGFDTGSIGLAAAAYIGMGIGRIASNAVTGRISTKIEMRVNNEIRADVFDKILNADWESTLSYHSGDLLNRLNSDVAAVASSVLGWIPSLITRVVQFAGAFFLIFYYDPTMAILALITAPFSLAVSRVLMKKMRQYNKRMKEAGSEMMAFNEEAFQNTQSIKSFGLIETFGERMRKVQNNYITVGLEYNKFAILTSSCMGLVGMVVSSTCFGWGVYRLWTHHISYGEMTMFLQLASVLSSGFSALINLVPSAIAATTSAGRLMAVADMEKEDYQDTPAVEKFERDTREEGIEVKISNADFAYRNGTDVFTHADVDAGPKEIVALVGPSGEGKTTMLRILLGLVKVKEGSAGLYSCDGKKQVRISPATRKLFAYVPQGNTMFSGTVAENMRMMKPEATDNEIIDVLREACAYDFVARLPEGINSKIGEKGSGFSEGQAQRLAIARALICDAPILLLDEATSALDVATERAVLRNIMKDNRARTCIVTTHRPSVLSICTRVYKISGGEVTLMDNEAVEKLVKDF